MTTQLPQIFLDLDQTIVHSVEPGEVPKSVETNAKKHLKHHSMDKIYTVYERPGLQEFFDFLFGNFDVSVWTAASKDYAMFVIDKCIKAGKPRDVKLILFSHHGKISKNIYNSSKNLRLLSKDLKLEDFKPDNTFIVDDYDEVYYTQPNNCIIAPGFYIDEKGFEKDSFLRELQDRLKTHNSPMDIKAINKGRKPTPRK